MAEPLTDGEIEVVRESPGIVPVNQRHWNLSWLATVDKLKRERDEARAEASALEDMARESGAQAMRNRVAELREVGFQLDAAWKQLGRVK